MKEPFLSAIPLLTRIEAAGYEAYFVGGAVRDFLLGREISDVDIATSATPQEIKEIYPKTIDVGVEHGTIIVLFNGMPYEVTTFRSESEYEDFRRPSEVQFIRSLEEDLQRRDFTMNAIAMNKDGLLIDPFNGKQAIREQMIQTVGKAEERFQEDALRMMRAVRFYSQLGFEMEQSTREALVVFAKLLENISIERKLIEFEKLLTGRYRFKALEILSNTGLYRYLPGMTSYSDELNHLLQFDFTDLTIEEMWVLLIHQFGINDNEVKTFLKNWKLPVKKINKIMQLVKWLDFRLKVDWTDEAIYHAGQQTSLAAERLYMFVHNRKINGNITSLMKRYELLPIKHRSELQVTGNDLQVWFQKKPGPWIKDVIEKVENAVINREISNRKELIREWLIACNQS
ncbi:CCA tRNA nucleotidyltransferase [Cytobacillus sp. FJAT-53684]|uniref:CCA-adding enzyme n=1 Tax=Cytobacillus mangrovibacter TaxID=3299024 RepID=A0ABW6JY44_9BACI